MSLISKREIRLIRNAGSPEEAAHDVRGNVVGAEAFFPLGTDVQTGDVVEIPGGVPQRRGIVQKITVFDTGSAAVNHIEASLSS